MSGRILIVDDLAVNRIVLQARFAEACYEPVLAVDGAGCLALAQTPVETRPDLILLDLDLPDLPGAAVMRALRSDPRSRDIPVIGLAASEDARTRLAALAAGADDVFTRTASERVLLARVRNLLRMRGELGEEASLTQPDLAEPAARFDPSGTIAMVSPCRQRAEHLFEGLGRHMRDRLITLSPVEALDEAAAGATDVFVIDASGDRDASGALRLLSELKSRIATRNAAICVTGIEGSASETAMAYDLGADDVAGSGVVLPELAPRRRSPLRGKHNRGRQRGGGAHGLRRALGGPLTGLHNRRHAGPELRRIATRAAAAGHSFAVMVVDLDRFKQVNDLHGHSAGDAVLVEVARRLSANLRDGDLLARIGGEEFLVALPETGAVQAQVVAERLCEAVRKEPVPFGSGGGIAATVSIGFAVSVSAVGQISSVDAVVEAADQALLAAKGAGRNRVTFRQIAA
ncbi:MAG TPA: diguanylate cyclase [Tabrizicola sp.]|nr:diguanylate cyclase [Tabrizicola sp.]